MNEASPHDPKPPSPDALPGNRLREPAVAESTSRALVRVSQPDLLRHAQLEKSRGRLLLAAFGFLVLFGAVAVKLSLATVFDPAEPKRAAILSRPPAPPVETPVSRAAVTDRNGEVLAVSLPMTALYANPRQIDDPVEAADKLRQALPQLEREWLIGRLTGERQFAYVARALTPRQMQAVNNLGIPGLYFEDSERRFFPQGRTAAHQQGCAIVVGIGELGYIHAHQRAGGGGPYADFA